MPYVLRGPGVFPPEMFAAFGEASQDVMLQIKLMPMLVLAAQICPASIEGTLFAFIMGATCRFEHLACA